MSAAPEILCRGGRVIRVRGLVQGVGFRPNVWRLARNCGLVGEVWNDAEGVAIRAWGDLDALDRFIELLRDDAPPLAHICSVESAPWHEAPTGESFRIVASRTGPVRTGVVPDAATCPRCVADTLSRDNRRFRYPFTNCTHCGPRLSIVRAVPYDRSNTSMDAFPMCEDCQAEYEDPGERRFHAQPNACPMCGPQLSLEYADGRSVDGGASTVDAAYDFLMQGAIVAIKGIGGFHLACDACNAQAVARLRERKRRFHKPFALMARDIEVIRRYCAVTAEAAQLLQSAAAPIVILPSDGAEPVAAAVAPAQNTLGFMLPYNPLHHLLLENIERPIVLTSGNVSDEPQCTGNTQAREKLSRIAEYLLIHDREIVNRVDDSVARIMDGQARVLRRARGYAPAPFLLPEGFESSPELLALGGELKNTFCLIKDGQAVLSQHMGDLEDAATYAEYRKNLRLYRQLFEHQPQILAVDKHPEYLSTKLGREWAQQAELGLEEVQHHHAHVVSCMAENDLRLHAAPVLGIALDGLGYGENGELWGGEFLLADYAGYKRLGTFKPVAMVGGAKAIREPWRNTYAHLVEAMGWERYTRDYSNLALTRFLKHKPLATLDAMMMRGFNSPKASSCGRLFDAVAAAIGICRAQTSYEGQAAIELEALVDYRALAEAGEDYPFAIREEARALATCHSPHAVLDPTPMWPALLDDLAHETPLPLIAARFHMGLAWAVVELACALKTTSVFDTVALSGGVFQNKTLLEQAARGLRAKGFNVITHRQAPANDGGLSLGQAAVAATRAPNALKTKTPVLGDFPLEHTELNLADSTGASPSEG